MFVGGGGAEGKGRNNSLWGVPGAKKRIVGSELTQTCPGGLGNGFFSCAVGLGRRKRKGCMYIPARSGGNCRYLRGLWFVGRVLRVNVAVVASREYAG